MKAAAPWSAILPAAQLQATRLREAKQPGGAEVERESGDRGREDPGELREKGPVRQLRRNRSGEQVDRDSHGCGEEEADGGGAGDRAQARQAQAAPCEEAEEEEQQEAEG